MRIKKFPISLPFEQCDFVEAYRAKHHYSSRSQVIKKALYLLQQLQLESDYAEANKERDTDFDATTSDGIDDAT